MPKNKGKTPVPPDNSGKIYHRRYRKKGQNIVYKILRHLDMNQAALAGALDITQQAVSMMVNNGRVSRDQVLPIETLTGGIEGPFNRYITRPDLHPRPSEAEL